MRRAGVRGTVLRAARLVASSGHGARHVVKSSLKQKFKAKVCRAAFNLGLMAVTAARGSRKCRICAQHAPAHLANSIVTNTPPTIPTCPRQIITRTPACPSGIAAFRAAMGPATFAMQSSADEQLHAALAHAVYSPSNQRRGAVALLDGNEGECGSSTFPRVCWYAYVGGDEHRGFWYSPDQRHLVLAERGTAGDADDLQRGACLAVGAGLAAVSGRARASQVELRKQLQSHDCKRVTVAGHSLGGSVAVFAACAASRALRVGAAHAFNPGGVPDLTRLLSCSLSSVRISVHHIYGDPLSVAFLPSLQRRYSRRHGWDAVHSHRMVHFL